MKMRDLVSQQLRPNHPRTPTQEVSPTLEQCETRRGPLHEATVQTDCGQEVGEQGH